MQTLSGKPIDPREGYYLVVLTFDEFRNLPKRVVNYLRDYGSRNYTNGVNYWIEISKYEMRGLLRTMEEEVTA